MCETGVAGISLDDNVRLDDAVTEMLASAREADNIVASTGCDVAANAPVEKIRAFIRAAKDYSRPKLA
jgi:uroporphyrinogen-III decarboxylase